MTFRAYTFLFFSLLAAFIVLLLVACVAVPKLFPLAPPQVTKATLAAAFLCIAGAFSVNVASGVIHKRMWGRGGVWNLENEGRAGRAIDIGLNAAVIVVAIWGALIVLIHGVPKVR